MYSNASLRIFLFSLLRDKLFMQFNACGISASDDLSHLLSTLDFN